LGRRFFAESQQLLSELTGVGVEAQHVERTAEALGAEIDQDERQVVDEPKTAAAQPPTSQARYERPPTTGPRPATGRPAPRTG
jgi:hypothetical protein